MEEAVSALPLADPGMPVEIGRIDKELGKLWESSGDMKTRASLINLVVYTENADGLAADHEVLSAVAARHACRAILIHGNPRAATSAARAWITAHCHVANKGSRQICSEQITFQLDGEAALALPNIVFSHLDSDLPLCLWWKGNFPEPLDEKLWAWVDRVVFDSASWERPAHQFAIIRHISTGQKHQTVLCDLNWTRLHAWRFALASLFDHASAFPHLSSVASVRLEAGPDGRTAAHLLLGWLASRLGWTISGEEGFFETSGGSRVAFSIAPDSTPALSGIVIECPEASFDLHLSKNGDFFESLIRMPGLEPSRQVLPAPRTRPEDTLLAELGRAGRHPLYTESLERVLPLIGH